MTNPESNKTRFKLYKHKKLWLVMGMTTTMLALGTLPATMAQADTAITTGEMTTLTPTSTSPSATSVTLNGETKTSTVTSLASVATNGDRTANSDQSAASGATNSTVDNNGSASGSESSQVNSSTGSTAPSAASAGTESGMAKSVTSQASSAATSTSTSVASTAVRQSSEPRMMRVASPAALIKTAATAMPSDNTVVTIADTNLSNAVKQGLNLATTDQITIGQIKNYPGNAFEITTGVDTPIKTLAGIENLEYLPVGVLIYADLQIDNAAVDIDFTPLAPLRFISLRILSDHTSQMNLLPLMAIDPSHFTVMGIEPNGGSFQGNQYAMTNEQLVQLAPWLTKIANNTYSRESGLELNNNCITDFSPLAGITKKGAYVSAMGQVAIVTNNPINLVIGQPVTFTGVTLTGLDGEPISDSYGYSWNTGVAGKHPISSLGQNQYYIDDVQQLTPGYPFLTYGHLGMPYSASWQPGRYVNKTYVNGVLLQMDIMVYQVANWQAHPNVTVKYVDANVQPIAGLADQVVNGVNIGDSFDLSPYLQVAGYRAVATSGPVTGTFGQDPQTLYIKLMPTTPAGQVTVNYVDTDGHVLATAGATYPDGQIVDLSYTTVQKAFAGYTFKTMALDSLAATGTLTATGGTVTYVYTKNVALTGNATVTYYDDTTGQILTNDSLTGDQGGTADYTTTAKIANYLQAGYKLVNDDVPASGIVYGATPVRYAVHLSHKLTTITASEALQKQVMQTIQYRYADGTTAAPDKVTAIRFTRTGMRDAVTGKAVYTDWQNSNHQTSFIAQVSPVIVNYTADQLVIAAVPVTALSTDMMTTVTYTANPVKPVDPDTGNTETPTSPDTDDANHADEIVVPTIPNTDSQNDGIAAADTNEADAGDTIKSTTPPVIDGPIDVDSGQADMIHKSDTRVLATDPQQATGERMTAKAQLVKLATDKSVTQPTSDLKPVSSPKLDKSALPQTNDSQQRAMGWLGLGTLIMTLLTAVGFKQRKN
ncbi:mucin-binding protein [Lactiplantibacillus songbeiensis]|uniref:MucBP domain-containing protein n=1 Tax=Lactiplantibacillus songbeiensis TaxID=2559920 RepID=A0ABW4BXE3_9LACO|nr:MucBP domain-containing protein [Lactiplantibacillus songbeiensis]